MSKLQKLMLKNKDHCLLNRGGGQSQRNDYSPITWERYFNQYQDVKLNSDTFRVYTCGVGNEAKSEMDNESPILVLLHGGGYSALTWALFTQEISSRIKCKILAIDLRGHGETHTVDDDDLSMNNLTNDVVGVVQKICNNKNEFKKVVFIGHSMGGAVAVYCAQRMSNCLGLCIIDVVEGTALESLAAMQIILKNRPSHFATIERAIQWCYKSGQTQNVQSARVSMPGQIKNSITGQLAASEIMNSLSDVDHEMENKSVLPCSSGSHGISTIAEEDAENGDGAQVQSENIPSINDEESSGPMKPPTTYIWRINLSKTEVHWKGWFQGLSENFLNTSVPKLLLLANINGLDTTLMVGQMQGKFQMQVLPRCGHAIHEDIPEKVADIIATFLVRHKIASAIGKFQPMLPAC